MSGQTGETNKKDVQEEITVWSKSQFYIGRPVRVWGETIEGQQIDITGLISSVVEGIFTVKSLDYTYSFSMEEFDEDPQYPGQHLHFLLMGPDGQKPNKEGE